MLASSSRRFLLAGILACSGLTVCGQDTPPAAKVPAPAKAAAGDPQKQWVELLARRDQIEKAAQKLQADFEAAAGKKDQKAQQEIGGALQKLIVEFQRDIQPKLAELAEPVYAKDPNNIEAAEMVVGKAFHENQYEKVIAVTDKLLEAGKSSPPLLNLAGVSHFAVQDFKAAHEILLQAQKLDQELFPQLGANFLEPSLTYQPLWETEKKLRVEDAAKNKSPETVLPQVLFRTSRGDIYLELFEDQAPNTVANFISLVEAKHYDKTKFHRVIPNFMCQGGDPNSKDADPSNDGSGGPGYTIPCECYRKDARMHFRGTLSMAHAGKDTGGSQFFITHLPTAHLNPSAAEQRGHTVFGRVIKGIEVSAAIRPGDQILSAQVLRKRNHPYEPKKAARGVDFKSEK
jgi:cyclophilin family peptidyl-prolyl cis-trans isomerase